MWVRLAEWMIAEREPPMSGIGCVLSGAGLRLRGAVTTARPDSPDGIVELQAGCRMRSSTG